jgi:hypothetical protein
LTKILITWNPIFGFTIVPGKLRMLSFEDLIIKLIKNNGRQPGRNERLRILAPKIGIN